MSKKHVRHVDRPTASKGAPKAASKAAASAPVDPAVRRERLLEAALYAAAALAAIVGAWWALQLWRADLHVPLLYVGDALSAGIGIKNTILTGWYQVIGFVGAPGALNVADYPSFDTLNYVIVRVIGFFSSDWALVMNVFYIATYPLSAIFAVLAGRRSGASRPAAFVLAVLFALTPFHFYRGEGHLFLSSYYVVPIAVMLAVAVGSAAVPFFAPGDADDDSTRLRIVSVASAVWAAAALAIGLSGLYYAFFGSFVIVIGGLVAYSRKGQWRRLAAAGLLVAIIAAAIVVQMVPTWVNNANSGPNTASVVRRPAETDLYGLRLTNLVLPIAQHRLQALDDALQPYRDDLVSMLPSTKNESAWVGLGLIGVIGLALSLGWLLFGTHRAGENPRGFSRLMDTLSVLNLSALLLGTVGGLGAILGIWVVGIRAYNRVSIFIAFISLLTAVMALDRWVLLKIPSAYRLWGTAAIVTLAVMFGVWDQTSPSFVPDYASVASQYASDAKIVSQLEQKVPAGSMVFQLPYMSFPENGSIVAMADYEPFRAALHSTTLRWSYGAIKGRSDSEWQRSVDTSDTPGMLDTLKRAGFRAVWVDRAGYEDGGAKLLSSLASSTAQPPLISDTRQMVVFIIP